MKDQYRALGRKTVDERLWVAKRGILTAIHIRFRMILSGNNEHNFLLKAQYLAGETLSDLVRECGLTPQRVCQIFNSNG